MPFRGAFTVQSHLLQEILSNEVFILVAVYTKEQHSRLQELVDRGQQSSTSTLIQDNQQPSLGTP